MRNSLNFHAPARVAGTFTEVQPMRLAVAAQSVEALAGDLAAATAAYDAAHAAFVAAGYPVGGKLAASAVHAKSAEGIAYRRLFAARVEAARLVDIEPEPRRLVAR